VDFIERNKMNIEQTATFSLTAINNTVFMFVYLNNVTMFKITLLLQLLRVEND